MPVWAFLTEAKILMDNEESGQLMLNMLVDYIQMFRLYLLLFIWVCASSILIERNIKLSQLQQSHGWIILGGTWISPGLIEMKAQIQMFSQLYEPNGYQLEILMLTQRQLRIENNHHCQVYNKQFELSTKLVKNRNDMTYKGKDQAEKQSNYNEFMFFVSRDCSHTLIKQYFQQRANINITVNIWNNKSNISIQESYCHWIIIANLIMSVFLVYSLRISLKNFDVGIFSQYILYLLGLAVVSNFLSEMKILSHIISGSHHYLLSYMQISTNGLYNSLFIFVFLNISLGWTITKENQSAFSSTISKITLIFISIALSALSYMQIIDFREESWIILSINCLSLICLATCIISAAFKLRSAKAKQSVFYIRIIMILFTKIISTNMNLLFNKETYFINRIIIETALQFINTLVNGVILNTFVGPSSPHFKICLRNKSFMQ